MTTNLSRPQKSAMPEVGGGSLDAVLRCKNCGAFLCRAQTVDYKDGSDATIKLEINCRNKGCKYVNILYLQVHSRKKS